MNKPSVRNIALFAFLSTAIVAAVIVCLRPLAYVPKNQAELDALRGQRDLVAGVPPFRIREQEKEYWNSRTGIDQDMDDVCGKSVEDGLVYISSGAFSPTDILSVIGNEKREAHFNRRMIMAYSPKPGIWRPEDDGVFNPEADSVKIAKTTSVVPVWRQKWLAWHIRYSGILELPYSIPHDPILDGGGMRLRICHDGFVYRYQRTYGVQQIEPAIQRVLEIIQAE